MGVIGVALILTQMLVFFASWLVVEVVGPGLDLLICGPFKWFAGVVSRANSPVTRYVLAIVWAAIGMMPGLAIAMATLWFIH